MNIDINEIIESFGRQIAEQAKKIAVLEATNKKMEAEKEALQNKVDELISLYEGSNKQNN